MEGNNQWGPFHDPVYPAPEGVPCQPDKTGLLYIQTWKILQFSNQHFLILSNTSSSLLMSMTGAQQEWYARKSQNQCCWLLSSCSLFKKGTLAWLPEDSSPCSLIWQPKINMVKLGLLCIKQNTIYSNCPNYGCLWFGPMSMSTRDKEVFCIGVSPEYWKRYKK